MLRGVNFFHTNATDAVERGRGDKTPFAECFLRGFVVPDADEECYVWCISCYLSLRSKLHVPDGSSATSWWV